MVSRIIAVMAALTAGFGVATFAAAQQPAAFGTSEDVDFDEQLWQQLDNARLVGGNAVRTHPYEGRPPHGKILELLEAQQRVGDVQGLAIVKKNFTGDATVQSALGDGRRALDSVTVMFRRDGFDSANQNWFWAKYNPDGSLQEAKGAKMAGKVAGCVACHQQAPGGDYIYTYDMSR